MKKSVTRTNGSCLLRVWNKDSAYWTSVVLAFGALLIFLPVVWFDFALYDDPAYVIGNPHVATGFSQSNLLWAFTTLHGETSYWHPLTWISHQIDSQFFKLNAGAHHLTNVVIHICGGLCLFKFLHRTTTRLAASAMVTALFLIHPLHVESVAWIAERKDVLSGAFWTATFCAYAAYVERRGVMRYLMVLVLSACALMAKPSAVTLPFTLLLLDVWPLNRLAFTFNQIPTTARLIVEKLPIFFMAAAVSVAAMKAQAKLGALAPVASLSMSQRLDNALVSYVIYIGKLFWPANLSVIYVRSAAWPLATVLLSAIFLFGVTALAVRLRHKHRYLLMGWLWFLGTLVPMIGLVQAGSQSMADRYTYISYIGLFIMLAWIWRDIVVFFHWPMVRGMLAPAVGIAALAAVTHHQLLYWRDSVSLFEHAAAVTRNNWVSRHNYGLALLNVRQYARGEKELLAAVELQPDCSVANISLGRLYRDLGDPVRATAYFIKAVAAGDSKYTEATELLAWVYAASEVEEARNGAMAVEYAEQLRKRGKEDTGKCLDLLAAACAARGDMTNAVEVATRACTLAEPGSAEERTFRARLNLFKEGQPYRTDFGARKRRASLGRLGELPPTLACLDLPEEEKR